VVEGTWEDGRLAKFQKSLDWNDIKWLKPYTHTKNAFVELFNEPAHKNGYDLINHWYNYQHPIHDIPSAFKILGKSSHCNNFYGHFTEKENRKNVIGQQKESFLPRVGWNWGSLHGQSNAIQSDEK
jgi:hypothetical protein